MRVCLDFGSGGLAGHFSTARSLTYGSALDSLFLLHYSMSFSRHSTVFLVYATLVSLFRSRRLRRMAADGYSRPGVRFAPPKLGIHRLGLCGCFSRACDEPVDCVWSGRFALEEMRDGRGLGYMPCEEICTYTGLLCFTGSNVYEVVDK